MFDIYYCRNVGLKLFWEESKYKFTLKGVEAQLTSLCCQLTRVFYNEYRDHTCFFMH